MKERIRVTDAMGRERWIERPVPHDCREHLVYREHEWREPHGEPCNQQWYECSVCSEYFTVNEVERALEAA